MLKNISIIAILAFAFCSAATTTSAQTAKCPPSSRCLSFEGEDNNTTEISISNGADALLKKWGIALDNAGRKLVWLTPSCTSQPYATSKCASVDLTGRHPKRVVAKDDLNKKVVMAAVGNNTVKITFEEFDGDTGEFLLVRGIWPRK